MPEVHADPEKLRQFASALSKSAEQLQQVAKGVQRSLQATGWDDSERQRFEEDFLQTMRSVTQFAERMKGEYAPQLLKKAEALERFRGGR